jgi:Family of unknown function (DUF6152)
MIICRKYSSARERLGGVQVRAKVLTIVPLLACCFAFSASLQAHHAARQVYEVKTIILMGVVTDYEWANPHSVLSIAVKDNRGKIEEWHAEILPPSEMLRAGWNKESVKPGDEVTLTGRPGRYSQHIMWLEYLVTPDGRKLGRKP